MAVSIVAAASQSGSPSPLSVTKPSGTADGDVMVAYQSNDFGTYAATTAPAGWTLLTGHDRGTDGFHLKIWTKTASGEGSSYSFAHGSSADACVTIVTLRGADTTTANWLFAAPSNITTPAATYDAASVSGAGSGAALLCSVMSENSNTATAFTWTPPAGMTKQADVQSSTWTSQSVATLLNPSNPTGTKTFTHTGAEGTTGGAITSAIVVPASGGGGASLTTNPADAVGITDFATTAQGFVRAPADTIGIADGFARASDYVRPSVDTVGLTDGLKTEAGRAFSDTVGVTDTASITRGFVRTTADTVGIADSVTFSRTLLFTATDSVGISDEGAEQTQDIAADYADALGIADAVTKLFAYVRPLTDLVGVTDSATFGIVSAGNIGAADAVGVADVFAAVVAYMRAPADAVGVTDALTIAVGFARTAADAVGVTDSAVFTLTTGQLSYTDPVGVTDTAAFIQFRAAQTFTNSVGITETSVFTIAGVTVPEWPDHFTLTATTRTLTLDTDRVERTLTATTRRLTLED